MTPLDKVLKRTLKINGRDYVITLSSHALKITEKGGRLGIELPWAELISGETALAVALHASIGKFQNDSSGADGRTVGTKPKPESKAKSHRRSQQRPTRPAQRAATRSR
jgi:hypothetical protein